MSVNVFDAGYYASVNPDLATAGLNTNEQLFSHFLNSGINEGRAFSAFVDLNFYRSSYSDLAPMTNRAAFDHLQNNGVAEGRRFSPFVDINHYLNTNADLQGVFGSNREGAFQHLATSGVVEPRQFSRSFDPAFYRSVYADLAGQPNWNNVNLLEHFKGSGLNEGRQGSSSFAINTYKAENPDVTNLSNLQAYLNYVVQDIQAGNPGIVIPGVAPESPSSPGPGFPVNLVAPDGWNVSYDEFSDIWVSATRNFYGGAFSINFQDDLIFEGGGVDETLLLSIDSTVSGGWGFIQENYTAFEGEQVATIRLSPSSNIKNATLDIIDDESNNDFANPFSLNDDSENFSSSSININATKELGEPNHAGNAGGASTWWSWTAPDSSLVQISTDTDFDTLLGVYTGSSISELTEVISNDDSPYSGDNSAQDSSVIFNAVAGTTYRIAVDGYNDGSGNVARGDIFLNLDSYPLTGTIYNFETLPIPDASTVTSNQLVTGLPGTIADVDIQLSITHSFDADLDVYLISPVGTRVELFTDVGGDGDDFSYTTLDDEGTTSITSGAAPFSFSTFQPEGLLSSFDNQNPNGIWSLEITDDFGGDIGSLTQWNLSFNLQIP